MGEGQPPTPTIGQQPIQHQAIVRIDAVVNQQMPNGTWHPRAVHYDNFFLRLEGESEQEVVKMLKEKLEELKKKWSEEGGELGVYNDDGSAKQ